MKIKVAIAQMDVAYGDLDANLRKGSLMAQMAKGCDILVFPELWTTDFAWENFDDLAHQSDKAMAIIQDLAIQNRLWIVSTTLTKEKQNVMHLISPQGEVVCRYAKIHLFSMMKEEQYLKAGDTLATYDFDWGRAGLSICYDFRFPELYRSLALQGCTLIFHSAVFPLKRIDHWKILTKARAIENQVFMISANRVGQGIWEQGGHSCMIDPWGNVLQEGGLEEELLTAEIDFSLIDQARSFFNILADRRPACY